jgi:hypothetical protein
MLWPRKMHPKCPLFGLKIAFYMFAASYRIGGIVVTTFPRDESDLLLDAHDKWELQVGQRVFLTHSANAGLWLSYKEEKPAG